MDLIIIESPNKVKKIAKYSGAIVKATIGHFKDLPKDEIGIDFNNGYKPKFVYTKKKIANEIKNLAKGKRVYIATDPDREGYAIGTMVYWEIKDVAKEVYRIEIHEITEKGIKEALKKAIPFEQTNKGLFRAFLGRRVGDRIVGYILSPIASKELGDRYSVGRVQSPALRLVVDREREIRDFKPEPYWELIGLFSKDGEKFKANYEKGKIYDEKKAKELLTLLENEKHGKIEKIEKKRVKQKPKPPFTTSELQIVANSQLKLSPEKTMTLAQDLFEAGLITYHRTDSVRLSDEYINMLREFIQNEFGVEYLSKKPNQFKSKNSQADAHEGIRPTEIYPISKIKELIMENGLTEEHRKLLELIYKRTVASQMADALFNITNILILVKTVKFKATGKTLVFDGFLKLYKENQKENHNQTLPKMEREDIVNVEKIELIKNFTKPPSRYKEGNLVKMLEKLGIGRPSTYASIMQTIKKRGYVKVEDGHIVPTPKGEKLIDFLNNKHNWIIDYELTKKMEEYLDRVENGDGSWTSFVKGLHKKMDFYIPQQDNTPSEKMINFAKDLSQKTGMDLPIDILKSKQKLKEFIDKAKQELDKQMKSKPISDKQASIVEKYAPQDIKQAYKKADYFKVREWLDIFFAGSINKRKKKKKRNTPYKAK